MLEKPVKTGFLVGYARVSTQEQNLDMQIEAMKRAGVKDDNIHTEKVSGASQRRPALDYAIQDLRPGDTFVVWRLDRLARSMRQLYAALDRIYAKGAFFRSLTEDFDFGSVSGKFVLGILGLVAEFERQLIAHRTKAAIESVRRRRKDKSWGPKVYMTPERIKRVGELLNSGMTGPAVAKKLNVSTASVYAFWKQSGKGRFVRKRKAAKKADKD
jgi:DNA invertase Pin-like site-specific DNA recombinase